MPRNLKRHNGDVDNGAGNETPSPLEIEAKAVELLARREHSRQELYYKLTSRGFPPVLIEPVLDDLAAQNLQSEARFAECYTRNRVERGFGPVRIRMELNERGVDSALVSEALVVFAAEWDERVLAARHKRFGVHPPDDNAERARQTRFLQQRGFSFDQIRFALQGAAFVSS